LSFHAEINRAVLLPAPVRSDSFRCGRSQLWVCEQPGRLKAISGQRIWWRCLCRCRFRRGGFWLGGLWLGNLWLGSGSVGSPSVGSLSLSRLSLSWGLSLCIWCQCIKLCL